MTDRVVWLTGSASGLGLHLTQRFLDKGYRVLACDINGKGLQTAAQQRGWNPDRVQLLTLDVTDNQAWQQALAELLERWGRLDYLFNVAGYLKPGYVLDADEADIHRHLDVNVKGVMFGSQTAARHMRVQGSGHIVNIASLAGMAAIPGIALYSTSKFAVRAFTLALAQELQDLPVAVTVVCPDAIETPMLDLQIDYDEAALTFSGGKTLTVDDVEHCIFDKVLPKRPIEIALPVSREAQAKLANAFPGVSQILTKTLRRRGLKNLRQRRAQ